MPVCDKESRRENMDVYSRYFKKYKVLFFTGVGCVAMEALCDLLQPTLMSRVIDDGIHSGSLSTVIRFGLYMLLVTALGACFAAIRNVLASRVSQSMGADLRGDLFEKMMRFSQTSSDRLESGSLITRMTNDTSQATQFINGLMRIYVKAPITCVGSIVLAVALSPRLSVVLLIAIALVTVFITVSMKLSYARFARVQVAMDRVNTVVQEYLLGVRLVKAFGRYGSEEEKFGEANHALAEHTASSQMVIAWFSPLMSLSVNIGIVLIVYFGSLLFQAKNIEVGQISAFISYMGQVLASLLMITNIFNTLVRTKASTERIREVFVSQEDFTAEPPKNTPVSDASLQFEHVTFAYPGGSGLNALYDLSFSVDSGRTLAIIGPTGSGKSTLAWLCLRFYDPNSGRILFGGRDLKTVDSALLRHDVAIAPQKSMLFSGTVLENIAWGNQTADRDTLIGAAQAAQADRFVREMPNGYDSQLDQGAVNLSGGQKQRLSIARALASPARLLILDDCTSALDAVTEVSVRKAIAEKAKREGCTVILITQRIGTAIGADRILVMQNGERVGMGAHRELMATCDVYREIYDSQIGEGGERT